MLIWAASLMLLSPTLHYSWSFSWQITEQHFNPLGLTLVKLGLLPKRAGLLFFFSFFFPFSPPKSIQMVSFATICSLPLGQMLFLSSPWHGTLQACLCSSAFLQLLAALVPPCPQVSHGFFQEQHLPINPLSVLSSSLKPEDDLPLATFQYFLLKYQILLCLQGKHTQKLYPFGLLNNQCKICLW